MAGKIVKTKSGKTGIIHNNFETINGKIPVILEDKTKLLCNPKDLVFIGFWD